MGYVILVSFIVVGAPVLWLLNRMADDHRRVKRNNESDASIRRSFQLQSDYQVLFAAQAEFAWSSSHYRELAREEALRRGLNPQKLIDSSIEGYPIDSPSVYVKGHFRRKGIPRS